MKLVILLVVFAGCHEELLGSHPSALATASGELQARGQADVEATRYRGQNEPRTHETHRVHLDDMVETRLGREVDDPDKPTVHQAHLEATLALRELLANCPQLAFTNDPATRAQYPNCKLMKATSAITVARERAVVPGLFSNLLGVAAAGGLVACTIACDSPWNYASGAALGLGVVAVVGIFVFVAAVTRGG